MYIAHDHIVLWCRDHEHRTLDLAVSRGFESYLNSLPWAGSHVDWRRIPSDIFDIPGDVPDHFLMRLRKSLIGSHDYLILLYNGDEPSLLCRLVDGIADMDLLYSRAPGTRYFCGADVVDGKVIPAYQDFGEFDGFGRITVPLRRVERSKPS